MKYIVYYGGTITSKEITDYKKLKEYREFIKKKLLDCDNVESVIDPFETEPIFEDREHLFKWAKTKEGLVQKDLCDVKESDIILLEVSYGSIGTLCEMVSAYFYNAIGYKSRSIIIVSKDEKIREHNFIKYFADYIFDDIEKAIELIKHDNNGVGINHKNEGGKSGTKV